MIDMDYELLKLCINIDNKNKLRIGLMTKDILEDIWSSLAIENMLFILANKPFINLIVRIILECKFKAKMVSFLNDGTFSFTYNKKINTLGQFSDLELFYINNF